MKPTSLHFLLGLAAPGILMPALLSSAPCAAGSGPASTDNGEVPGLRIRVRFEAEQGKTPLDGRVLVMLSTDPADEPRFQINDSPEDAADLRHRRRGARARPRRP